MPSAWTPVRVDVIFPPAHRSGTGTPSQPRQFWGQSINLTNQWSSDPGSCEVVYVGGGSPVTVGYTVIIKAAGHTIQGVCKSDVSTLASAGGIKRTLRVVDNREYLDWDCFYGCFNLLDEQIVAGKRIRRYKHLLPANHSTRLWTYTTSPYTVEQLFSYVFTAATTQDVWTRVLHQDQINYPVYDLNFDSGAKLKAVLQQITEAQGLKFSIIPVDASNVVPSDAYRLVWNRMGTGILPAFTSDSDDRESGLTLTDYPTRVRVLGERNQYMVHNITLEKDWVTAWESLWDFVLFQEDIYQRGSLPTAISITPPGGGAAVAFAAGTPFTTVGANSADPEQMVARFHASAMANVITLKEYVALRNAATPTSGDAYADYRKFSNRSRMDAPVKIYLNNILFRAFRIPSSFTFTNAAGATIYASSIRIADKMVSSVTHDPTTGVMSPDLSNNHDGNGYAIAQGYMVGSDMFKTLQPERFRLEEWTNIQTLWQHVEFNLDDSGEEQSQFLIFSDPVINSSDLISVVNGYGVFKANPTFTVPAVKATLTIEAEKYSYVSGTGNRDDFENVQGLYAEYVVTSPGATPTEIAFADGRYANAKAAEIADSLLARQFTLYRGSMKRHIIQNANGTWPTGTMLTGMIDRVSMTVSPSGFEETISLTNEQPRKTFTPIRDLERVTKQRTLIPGQKELQTQANQQKMIAMALKNDPNMRKTLTDALKGYLGNGAKYEQTTLAP